MEYAMRTPIIPYNVKATDVLRSTAAAPTYYPPHPFELEVDYKTGEKIEVTAVDGGVVCNAPYLLGSSQVLSMDWSTDGG